VTARQTVIALLAGGLLAACSVERLPVPSAPLLSVEPSGSAKPSSPEPSFAGLPIALERRLLRSADSNDQWLVGTLADGWQRLGVGLNDAWVDDAWGLITVTSSEGGEIVVSTLDDSGALREVYRTVDGADTTTYASISADGSVLVVYGASIGTRVVDLRTGVETDFPPARAVAGLGPVDLQWSPDGTSFLSGECDMSTCWLRVVDLKSLSATRIEELVPLALGERQVLGYRNHPADRLVLLLDVNSGDSRPVAAVIDGVYGATALSESRFLIWGGMAGDRYGFDLVDTETGTDALLATDPLLRFPVKEFVNPDWVLLKSRDPGTVYVDPGSTLDVLDLVAGEIVEDVIAVPPAP
jgi:hypothetical protein